jgi:23S rRNA (guanosine2251-2'-O)-methyltransferase
MNSFKYWIGGKQAVKAAILNPSRKIFEVCSSKENQEFIESLIQLSKKKIQISYIENKKLNKIFKSGISHQGIAVLVENKKIITSEEILNQLCKKHSSVVVVLDDITDQRNIGSIIRSCVAFFVDAIFIPKKNYNEDNESMNKSASGGVEYIPIIPIININNLLEKLKAKEFWVVGLDLDANKEIKSFNWSKKSAIVLGSEGSGIRRLVKHNCDELIKIKINPKIDSLNVSNAISATLALYQSSKE